MSAKPVVGCKVEWGVWVVGGRYNWGKVVTSTQNYGLVQSKN
jgi:hypothetical protein